MWAAGLWPTSWLALTPHAPIHAQWEYGVALLYQGRLDKAAEQFECCAALDRDDAEPWLWRFLVRGWLKEPLAL